jgi:hypothetical protein
MPAPHSPDPADNVTPETRDRIEPGTRRSDRPAPEQGEKESWGGRLALPSLKWIAGIVAGVITLVVGGVLTAYFTGALGSKTATETNNSPATTPLQGRPAEFTVQDAINHGAWALKTPNSSRLAPHESRPSNAARWLAEGTKVKVVCARKSTPYRVIVYTTPTHWRWWARLKGGSWLAMANFYEVNADGSQGFPLC